MKRFRSLVVMLILFAAALSGCEAIGDIFQAGVWVGAILVIGIIALIVWLVSKAKA
jgi:TRAP-type C4-dicarboxylate transport system permease large subunit